MIKAGVNVNEIEKCKGHSPLSLATYKNLKNTIKAILDNNGDPNFILESSGDSILHLAISNNNLEVVKILLEKGANPIVINKEGVTTIELALKHSSTEIYRILIEESNKRNQKENEIVNDLITEQVSSGKKKKFKETKEEEVNVSGVLLNVLNSMEVPKKCKKQLKIDYLKKNKKYKFSPNIQIPFTVRKNSTSNQLNMFISLYN